MDHYDASSMYPPSTVFIGLNKSGRQSPETHSPLSSAPGTPGSPLENDITNSSRPQVDPILSTGHPLFMPRKGLPSRSTTSTERQGDVPFDETVDDAPDDEKKMEELSRTNDEALAISIDFQHRSLLDDRVLDDMPEDEQRHNSVDTLNLVADRKPSLIQRRSKTVSDASYERPDKNDEFLHPDGLPDYSHRSAGDVVEGPHDEPPAIPAPTTSIDPSVKKHMDFAAVKRDILKTSTSNPPKFSKRRSWQPSSQIPSLRAVISDEGDVAKSTSSQEAPWLSAKSSEKSNASDKIPQPEKSSTVSTPADAKHVIITSDSEKVDDPSQKSTSIRNVKTIDAESDTPDDEHAFRVLKNPHGMSSDQGRFRHQIGRTVVPDKHPFNNREGAIRSSFDSSSLPHDEKESITYSHIQQKFLQTTSSRDTATSKSPDLSTSNDVVDQVDNRSNAMQDLHDEQEELALNYQSSVRSKLNSGDRKFQKSAVGFEMKSRTTPSDGEESESMHNFQVRQSISQDENGQPHDENKALDDKSGYKNNYTKSDIKKVNAGEHNRQLKLLRKDQSWKDDNSADLQLSNSSFGNRTKNSRNSSTIFDKYNKPWNGAKLQNNHQGYSFNSRVSSSFDSEERMLRETSNEEEIYRPMEQNMSVFDNEQCDEFERFRQQVLSEYKGVLTDSDLDVRRKMLMEYKGVLSEEQSELVDEAPRDEMRQYNNVLDEKLESENWDVDNDSCSHEMTTEDEFEDIRRKISREYENPNGAINNDEETKPNTIVSGGVHSKGTSGVSAAVKALVRDTSPSLPEQQRIFVDRQGSSDDSSYFPPSDKIYESSSTDSSSLYVPSVHEERDLSHSYSVHSTNGGEQSTYLGGVADKVLSSKNNEIELLQSHHFSDGREGGINIDKYRPSEMDGEKLHHHKHRRDEHNEQNNEATEKNNIQTNILNVRASSSSRQREGNTDRTTKNQLPVSKPTSYRQMTPNRDIQSSEKSASWLQDELQRRFSMKREINHAILERAQSKQNVADESFTGPTTILPDNSFARDLSSALKKLPPNLNESTDDDAALDKEVAALNGTLSTDEYTTPVLNTTTHDHHKQQNDIATPRRLDYEYGHDNNPRLSKSNSTGTSTKQALHMNYSHQSETSGGGSIMSGARSSKSATKPLTKKVVVEHRRYESEMPPRTDIDSQEHRRNISDPRGDSKFRFNAEIRGSEDIDEIPPTYAGRRLYQPRQSRSERAMDTIDDIHSGQRRHDARSEMKRFASDTRAALRSHSGPEHSIPANTQRNRNNSGKLPDRTKPPLSERVSHSPFRSIAISRSLSSNFPGDSDCVNSDIPQPLLGEKQEGRNSAANNSSSSRRLGRMSSGSTETSGRTGASNVGSTSSAGDFAELNSNVCPVLVKSMDVDHGILKGDITLSLLSDNSGLDDSSLKSAWAGRVHGAIWRCRRMRQSFGDGEVGKQQPGTPLKGRSSLPVDLDKGRVAGGFRSVASTQEAALLHLKHDEIDEALELFEDIIFAYYSYFEYSLKTREKNPELRSGIGSTDFKPYIGVALHNLGILNLLNGDYREALSFFTRAVENRRSCLGEGHSDHVASLVKLAICLYALNDFGEAHSKLEQALGLAKRNAPTLSDQAQIAEILNNLGCLSYMCGQPETAKAFFKDSLDVQFYVLSESLYRDSSTVGHTASLNISITRANIGFLKLVTKDLPVAITALEAALMEQQVLLKGAHDTVVATMDHLAVANLLFGSQQKAALMFGRILHLQMNEYGPNDRRCFVTKEKIKMVRSQGTSFQAVVDDLQKTFTVPKEEKSFPPSSQHSSKAPTPTPPCDSSVVSKSESQQTVSRMRPGSKVMKVFSSMRKKKTGNTPKSS